MNIKARSGQAFPVKILEVSDKLLVAMGDFVLPRSMQCDLQIVIPPRGSNPAGGKSEFQGAVQQVVFAEGGIRLAFRVESLPPEIERLADECGIRRARSMYVTV